MTKALFSVVVVVACLFSNPVDAEEVDPAATSDPPRREGFNVFKMFRKSGRGLTNIASSPLEIPNQMVRESKRHKTFCGAVAGYVTGIPFGCGMMLYRCGAGLVDFVTAPVPMPTYERSFIEPEYLFPQDPYTQE